MPNVALPRIRHAKLPHHPVNDLLVRVIQGPGSGNFYNLEDRMNAVKQAFRTRRPRRQKGAHSESGVGKLTPTEKGMSGAARKTQTPGAMLVRRRHCPCMVVLRRELSATGLTT